MEQQQLEIEVPIEATESNRYAAKKAEYETLKTYKDKNNVFLCYCGQTKKYFVSMYTSRKGIEQYKSIKIIE